MYRLATQTSLRQVPRSIANSISRPALATPRFIQPVAIRTMMDSPYSAVKVSDRVKHDHAELEKQYRNILAAEDEDTKVRWQNQFIWELARHSIAEEIIVYPAFEKFVPNGLVMAEKDRAEHQRVRFHPISTVHISHVHNTANHQNNRSRISSTSSRR